MAETEFTPQRIKAAIRGLTRTQRMYVKDGSIHGDCTMQTVRALEHLGLFRLEIDSPNGQCGFMVLTRLGEAVRAALPAGAGSPHLRRATAPALAEAQ